MKATLPGVFIENKQAFGSGDLYSAYTMAGGRIFAGSEKAGVAFVLRSISNFLILKQ